MKHTKGPLEVRRHSNDQIHFFKLTDSGYESFCKASSDNPANLFLIKAAPEMLEALEIALQYLPDIKDGDIYLQDKFKQLINKAKGL